jgi:hypothetical protein
MAIYFRHHDLFRFDLIEVARVCKIPPLPPPSPLLFILTNRARFELVLVEVSEVVPPLII